MNPASHASTDAADPASPRAAAASSAANAGRRPLSGGRRRLYRSRDGLVFGVCRGLADYSELSVGWIRVIVVALTLLTWVIPLVVLYLAAAVWMRPVPRLGPEAEEDWQEYQSSACTQSMALARLKRELDAVEYRALQLDRDDYVRQYEWEQRLKR